MSSFKILSNPCLTRKIESQLSLYNVSLQVRLLTPCTPTTGVLLPVPHDSSPLSNTLPSLTSVWYVGNKHSRRPQFVSPSPLSSTLDYCTLRSPDVPQSSTTLTHGTISLIHHSAGPGHVRTRPKGDVSRLVNAGGG